MIMTWDNVPDHDAGFFEYQIQRPLLSLSSNNQHCTGATDEVSKCCPNQDVLAMQPRLFLNLDVLCNCIVSLQKV